MSSRRTMYCEKKKEKKWWGYIRNILTDYPNGSKNEIDAVRAACLELETLSDGKDRLKLMKLLFLEKRVPLRTAADFCFISYATAKRWQRDFIFRVGRNFKCDGLY